MHDSDGNVVLCKCGKVAGSGAMGMKSYIVWCEDCSPYKNEPADKFVYRPPVHEERSHLMDSFILKLRNSND